MTEIQRCTREREDQEKHGLCVRRREKRKRERNRESEKEKERFILIHKCTKKGSTREMEGEPYLHYNPLQPCTQPNTNCC